MEKNYLPNFSTLLCVMFCTLFFNTLFSQVEIAKQRFNNGSSTYQILVVDKDGPNPSLFIPPPSQLWSDMEMNGYTPDAQDWNFLATTDDGQIRIVNTSVAPFVSPGYSLEFVNYWKDQPTLEFEAIDISSYEDVTFSVDYRSTGNPDKNEDLILDYAYSVDNGVTWVNTVIDLINGDNGTGDVQDYGVNGIVANPFQVAIGDIPDNANAFKATISATFKNGSDGSDHYYIDDVVLSGVPVTLVPVAICNSDFSINLDAFGNASITANDIDNGSYIQTSGSMTLSIDKTEFTCADLGPNVISLTVFDGIQSVTCTTTVTVNGYAGPIVAPNIPSTTTYCSYTAPTPADVSYQCSTITPTTTDPITYNTAGNYSITWIYYDSVTANSTTTVQNITIQNIVAPTGITVTAIGGDTATLSWDNQVGIDSYEIRYKKNGLVNWQTITSTTNSIILTGLDQLTLYDFQVATVCGANSVYSLVDDFATLGHTYCIPDVINFTSQNYIKRVRFGTLATNIDNTSTYTNGYDDYTATDIADVYKNDTYTITIDRHSNQSWQEMGYAVWIDYNGDGDFEDAGEDVWQYLDANNTTTANTVTANILIPTYAVNGQTTMRVATRRDWYPADSCDGSFDGQRGEVEDYALNLLIKANSPQEIDVFGNNNLIVDDSRVAELDENNNTDFGIYDVYEVPLVKTYKITNNGSDPLVLTGTPLVQFLTNTGDFTITQPTISTLAVGESTTFTIIFNPTTVGTKSATVVIHNDDVDIVDTEDEYTFLVQAEAVKTFPDTDGDGVPDNVDGDDDNDGILDFAEDAACKTYPYATQVETIFLNETFGSGYDRATVEDVSPGSSTTYCYEDGTASCGSNTNVDNGAYTLYYQTCNGDGIDQTPNEDVASYADAYWYSGLDHTPDAIDGAEPGRMLIVNADYDPGIFYSATINGVTPGVEVVYGFSVINLIKTEGNNSGSRIKPQVAIAVYDPNGVQIALESSGLIATSSSTDPDGGWVNLETTFTTTSSQFTIQLINDQIGGSGNDLAIDDIYVKQVLCDLDGDGVADIIDLDNDDDGIPNIVELGLVDADYDATLFGSGWVDANGNGVHDSYEGGAPLIDTDGDGIPDYIDLDSDNDGIFDAVEYDGFGDVDINGDGVGDGSDVYDVNVSLEQDGDGILPIMDLNDDGLGVEHGSNAYPDPLDDDHDGIPNYLDIDSNDATNDPSNGNDISATIYADLDANNDGVIDGNTDVDLDGVLDSFDTDTNVYGSPRDLDDSYTLYFDGRNDYISENVPVINAWSSGTLMAWVKLAPASSGQRRIVGQDNFYLTVNANNTVSGISGGNSLTSSSVLPDNIWVHVAVSFNNTDGNMVLYVNGNEEDLDAAGSMPSGTTDLTIGRRPGISGEENVATSEYFKGEIDEVRIFNAGLSDDEIQKMIYQELDDTNSFVSGKIIPIDISTNSGSSLQRYYKMDQFTDDVTSDKKTVATGAKLYNIKNIYFQTAPLPYETSSAGSWADASTWLHGDVWDITNVATNKDWAIVHIKHDVTTTHSTTTLGLIIDDVNTLTVSGEQKVQNSWYFSLDGTLDLMDDCQLIQTETSNLVTSADGKILRRQEGSGSAYWYNYWASPVGALGATSYSNNNTTFNNANNTSFTLDMLNDESGFDSQFTNGYTGSGNISTYWLYTFINGRTYWDWAKILTSTPLKPGVGYTQKGTGTGATEQQYIFEGKPNNGTILIDVTDVGGTGSVADVSKTEYLLGNPYASAIDVHKFIDDNEGVISGSLQLWQQWGGTSHVLNEYQGGYAQVNKMGSIRARQFIGLSGDTEGGVVGVLKPSKYLSVGQGFIVEIEDDGTPAFDGTVEFNNSQRVFIKESDANGTDTNGSVFFKSTKDKSSSEDTSKTTDRIGSMQKIRLEFYSVEGPETRHELLLGFSDFTTDAFDYGYDAKNTQTTNNDLNLDFEGQNMNIQAYAAITDNKVVPLNFKSSADNAFEIRISELENIDETQAIYIKDNLTGAYFDLTKDAAYGFSSGQGVFNNRFEIVFQSESKTLSAEASTFKENYIFYQNKTNMLFAKKLSNDVSKLSLINMRGQIMLELIDVSTQQLENGIQFDNIITGTYIVYMRTDTNEVLTQKIVVN